VRSPPSLLFIVYVVVGVIVAAIDDYFNNLNTAGRVLTLIAAIIMWPILLFGFDIRIHK
jgi:Mn2+/Fe2+ NRAMP family transporter